MKLKIFSLISFLFIINFWFLATPAQAQTISLDLYPPLLEVTLKPGKSITQVYKITNNSEQDFVMNSQIVPFAPADEFGGIQLQNYPLSIIHYPFLDWFSFQNADLQLGQGFLLKSGQTQQVVLAVKTPPNAKEDDYYLTLLFETIPGTSLGGQSEAQAQAKIGANILLTVSETGEPPRKAEIIQFDIRYLILDIGKIKIIDSFSQPQFLLRIKNTGRSFFKPMGTITTTGWLGQKFISDLLPENVLTNSVRALNCAPPDSPDKVAPCQIKTKFLFGPYQAKVEFGLDKVSNDYGAETIFWAIPFKLIIVLLTTIFILFIIKLKLRT